MITKQELQSIIKIHGKGFKFKDIPTYIRVRENWIAPMDFYEEIKDKHNNWEI